MKIFKIYDDIAIKLTAWLTSIRCVEGIWHVHFKLLNIHRIIQCDEEKIGIEFELLKILFFTRKFIVSCIFRHLWCIFKYGKKHNEYTLTYLIHFVAQHHSVDLNTQIWQRHDTPIFIHILWYTLIHHIERNVNFLSFIHSSHLKVSSSCTWYL